MSPKTAFLGRSAGAVGLSGSAVGNNPKNGRWRVAGGGRKRPVAALVPPPREDSELQTLLWPLSTLRNAAGEKCGLASSSHHMTAGARDTTARTSLRLLAVLNVQSSTPARAKRLAPFSSARLAPSPDSPLTHFDSPRGEKCRLCQQFGVLLRDRGCKDVDLTVHPPFENGQPRRPAASSVRGPRHVVTSHDSP